MKSDLLLGDVIGGDVKATISVVLKSQTSNFGQLVAAAGLNPQRHFRHADLSDIDFSDTDLEGFDFTGADLRGAHGARVKWSLETTKLTDASLDGSLFAHRISVKALLDSEDARLVAKQVRSYGWADQVLWAMAKVRRGNADLDRDRAIAWTVFDRTKDGFVKSEVLRLMESVSTPDEPGTYDLLLDFINVASEDVAMMSKVIRVLARSPHRKHPRVNAAVTPLLTSRNDRIAALAVEFLVSNAASREELKEIASSALSRRASPVRKTFIASLAHRFGQVYEMAVRNQVTQDFRDVHQSMSRKEMELLVRNVKRRASEEQASLNEGHRHPTPFLSFLDGAYKDAEVESKIDLILKTLRQFGIHTTVQTGVDKSSL
jgi:hypothetical protein